ncbi:MAG TPA: hypothetical protein VK668_04220 [Mucilaginibacter sp.]|nr:hypothetical protein [Mucilaginibacter sp.]
MRNKLNKVVINGSNYFKASYSKNSRFCVGVNYSNGKFKLINTKEGKTTIEFTEEEWLVFVNAVKTGEFDDLKSIA